MNSKARAILLIAFVVSFNVYASDGRDDKTSRYAHNCTARAHSPTENCGARYQRHGSAGVYKRQGEYRRIDSEPRSYERTNNRRR